MLFSICPGHFFYIFSSFFFRFNTFLRDWELKIFSKAFMNLEHSSQYNKMCSECQILFKPLFFLSPVIKSVLLHDTLTLDFLYPVIKVTFSTIDTYKQIKILIFSLTDVSLALFCLMPADILIIVTTLDLPALSDVIMRNVCRLFNNHTENRGTDAVRCWLL